MTEIKLSDLTSRVAFCDPAGQKGQLKRVSARAAIACVAADDLRRVFCLHLWAARCSTRELIDKMYWVQDTFKPAIFGVESNAMQELFKNTTDIIAHHEGKRLPLLAVEQYNKIDKDSRIRFNLQSPFAYGQIFYQEHQVEAISETTGFPMAKYKDILDALASAVSLLPAKTPEKQRFDRLTAVRVYLEKCGTSSWQIERRLQELRAEMRGGSSTLSSV